MTTTPNLRIDIPGLSSGSWGEKMQDALEALDAASWAVARVAGVVDATDAIMSEIALLPDGVGTLWIPPCAFTETIVVPEGVHLRTPGGELVYSGTEVGISVEGDDASIDDLKLRCTSTAATVRGIKLTDTRRVHLGARCIVTGAGLHAGQIGVYLWDTGGGTYWNRLDCRVDTWDRPVVLDTDDAVGVANCNANYGRMQLHNALTYCLDLLAANDNDFDAQMDTFFDAIGLHIESGRNKVRFKAEGGAGSAPYLTGAGSVSKIEVDNQCPNLGDSNGQDDIWENGQRTLSGHLLHTQNDEPTASRTNTGNITIAVTAGSTDAAGSITVTNTAGSAQNSVVTVTFDSPFQAPPKSVQVSTLRGSGTTFPQAGITAVSSTALAFTFDEDLDNFQSMTVFWSVDG